MTAGVRTCIAGDRLRIGQCVRLCRIDGQVYPLRPNRPRRKPWKLLGVVASSADVGEPVKIICSGYCVVNGVLGWPQVLGAL